MAKKKEELDQIPTNSNNGLDWEQEKTNLNEEFNAKSEDKKEIQESSTDLSGAVVLTEEQKRILLREEIKKQNRGDAYSPDSGSNVEKTKKELEKHDKRERKTGSLAVTIVASIFTAITLLLLFFVFKDGDVGKMIILGLFLLLPAEIIGAVCSLVVLVTNIIFMCSGKFSWYILFNLLLSLALVAANVFAFIAGAEMLFS